MKKSMLAVIGLVVIVVAAAFAWRWHLIQELRKPILSELTDPDSAKFRGETIVSPWTVSDSVLCGEVNAKNQMGGYVGYKRFFVWTSMKDPKKHRTGIDDGGKIGSEYVAGACDDGRYEGIDWWWMRW